MCKQITNLYEDSSAASEETKHKVLSTARFLHLIECENNGIHDIHTPAVCEHTTQGLSTRAYPMDNNEIEYLTYIYLPDILCGSTCYGEGTDMTEKLMKDRKRIEFNFAIGCESGYISLWEDYKSWLIFPTVMETKLNTYNIEVKRKCGCEILLEFSKVQSETNRRFMDFKLMEKEFNLLSCPFSVDVSTVPDNLQLELIVLGRNISLPFIPQSFTNPNQIRKYSVHTAKNHRKPYNNRQSLEKKIIIYYWHWNTKRLSVDDFLVPIRLVVPEKLVENLYSYALTLLKGKFTVKNLMIAAATFNSREIVIGTAVKQLERVPADELQKIVHSDWMAVYVSSFECSKTLSTLVKSEEKYRNYCDKTIFGKLLATIFFTKMLCQET
ncbi:hypothetical protein A3Q56_02648 [Intoshia linei]|uniref:Uncharacterized protein n=1 Tax=Intoshia linei TaxID=1819745 RepID=A0A177B7L3_9BILA|nr:hypothetical protein A3Q56_02648 [Intoshia linei]